MKKINIARPRGCTRRNWKTWIKELSHAGFEIATGNPMAMELQTVFARPGEIVLLDSLLPNLSRFIKRTLSRCPEAHIIVATSKDQPAERNASHPRVQFISDSLPTSELMRTIHQLNQNRDS